jgi:hypothetical protein
MLTNSLDSTLAGALANGIKGLAFVGGNVAGNVLSSAFFFKGNGFTGIGAGFATGIYVDTTGAGNIYYNDSTAAGSFIFASVGSAAATLTNADFVYAGGPSFSPISPIRTIPISSDFAGLEVAETTTLDTANLSKFDTANLSKFDTANLSALDTANLSAFDTANLSTRVFAV